MFELIVNILLFIFLGYTYFTHVLEAPVPAMAANNPYALQPDTWPKAIIILLLICLAINIFKIIKRNKGKEDFTLSAFAKSVPKFFTSKMFVGMVIIVIASFILEPLGFTLTTFLVLVAYGMLLGERRIVRLVIVAVLISLVLYLVFNGLLSVNLPRGTVGVMRDFALFLESIIGGIKGIFG